MVHFAHAEGLPFPITETVQFKHVIDLARRALMSCGPPKHEIVCKELLSKNHKRCEESTKQQMTMTVKACT